MSKKRKLEKLSNYYNSIANLWQVRHQYGYNEFWDLQQIDYMFDHLCKKLNVKKDDVIEYMDAYEKKRLQEIENE